MPVEKQKASENPVPAAARSGCCCRSLELMQRFPLAARSQASAFHRRISACCGGSMPTKGKISANSPRISE